MEFDFSSIAKPPQQLYSPAQQNDAAYYTAALRGRDVISDFQQANSEYLLNGDSTLVNETTALLQQDENEKRSKAVATFLGDPAVTLDEKRAVVKQYAISKEVPVSLLERYAEKMALENPDNDKLDDVSFAKQFRDKIETSRNSRQSQESFLGAFMAGIAHKEYAAARSFGLVSDKDYELLVQSYRPIASERPIAAGLGSTVPLMAPLVLGPGIGSILSGIIDGTARYSELDKVEQSTRLTASLAQAGMTSAMMRIPIIQAATVVQAMLLNGAGFVALGQLNRSTQNYILDAYPELQQKTGWENITIEAVAGMIAGGLFGRRRINFDEGISVPDSRFKARPPTPDSMPKGPSFSGKVYEGVSTQVADEQALLHGPVLATDPASPLGVTALHNETAASKLGAGAVADDTGQIARAVGETRAQILADHYFSKINKEELPGVPSGIVSEIDALTQAGINSYVRTETNPFLYNKEFRADVQAKIVETVQGFKNAKYHQSKSYYDETEDGIVKSLATYGPTPTTSYKTFEEAQHAWRNLRDYVPYGTAHIAKLDTATNTIKPLGTYDPSTGSYYVQWEFAQPFNRLGTYLFGEDAVSVSVQFPFSQESKYVNKIATELARIPYVNRFFLPGTHFLKKWVTDPAVVAEDSLRDIEKPLLAALQKAEGKLSRSQGELDALHHLITTSRDDARVWTYAEISQLLRSKGMYEAQVADIAEAYFINRRVSDLTYLYVNRKSYNDLTQREMQAYHVGEKPLFAKPVKQPEGVTQVWDEVTQTVVPTSKKELDQLYAEGGTLVEMAGKKNVGDAHVSYAIMKPGIRGQALPEFVLPRVKGYSPTGWEEYFFVDRTPKKATLDGQPVVNLTTMRTTHAAAGSMADAKKLQEQLSKEHPDADWSIRKDRNLENNLLADANIYANNLARSKKKGEDIVSIDGKARLIDPAIIQRRTVAAVARMAAFDEYIELFQRSFVKSYHKYLDSYQYPLSLSNFRLPKKASIEEVKEFENAIANYLYMRSLVEKRGAGEEVWKRSLYWLGSVVDKYSEGMAKSLQYLGDNVYPPEALRRVAAAFFIYLNPIRTAFVQSSQVLQFVMASPRYMLDPSKYMREVTGLLWGLLHTPHTGLQRGNIFTKAEESIAGWVGSKMMDKTHIDYTEMVQAFRESGIPYAIDNNLMVAGVLGRGDRALHESPLEFAAETTRRVVTSAPKIGKMVGFDPAELVVMASAWLEARYNFMKANPDVKWTSKEALAQIQADARLRSGELNQAGALSWNRGIFSLPMQFVSTPYKLLLNTVTGKAFTKDEKSRMFLGNVLWFGPQAYFLGSAIDYLREQYGDSLTPELWLALRGGIVDLAVNFGLDVASQDKTPTSLAISKAFTPFGDKLFISDKLSNLSEKQFAEVMMGPSWSIFNTKNGRIPTALRDMSSLFQSKDLSSKEAISRSMQNIVEIASGGTNWMKMQIALDTGKLVTSTGNDTGLHADRKAAIAQLFGVQTWEQLDFRVLQQKNIDENKEIAEEAKYLAHIALENARANYGSNPDAFQKNSEMLQSYMSIVAQNPHHEYKLRQKLPEVMREMVKNGGDNVYTYMYLESLKKSEEERAKMSKFLRSSSDPRLQQLADDINLGLNVENGKGY